MYCKLINTLCSYIINNYGKINEMDILTVLARSLSTGLSVLKITF
jgi:hypothetical protein